MSRVQRLEVDRTPHLSPFERDYGSLDSFEAECRAGMEAGVLDSRDMPVVMLAVRRWHRDGLFAQRAA